MNTSGIETLASLAEARANDPTHVINREFLMKQTPFHFSHPMTTSPIGSLRGPETAEELKEHPFVATMQSANARRLSMIPSVSNGPRPPAMDRRTAEIEHALYQSVLMNQRREEAMAMAMTSPAPVTRISPVPAMAYSGPEQAGSNQASTAASSRRRKPNFAEKLHMVLSNKDCKDLITWLPSGRSFCIIDKVEFSKKILPKYLREAKFESFSRRLKRWGFRKVYTPESQIIFSHDIFQRDEPEMCKLMNGREKLPDENESFQPAPPHVYPQAAVISDSMLQQEHHMRQELLGGAALRADFYLRHQQKQNHQVTLNLSMPMPHQRQLMLSHQQQHEPVFHGNMALSRANNAQAVGGAKQRMMRLNDDISHCEEQLLILQKLKLLKERRRMLTVAGSNNSSSFLQN